MRLTKAREFQQVFAEGRRAYCKGFVVIFRANGLGHARLGLAISRKCARRAVKRNRLKRLVRESFRRARCGLPAVDIVVLCGKGTAEASNRRLFADLEQAWNQIMKLLCVAS
nr:ribonuclease P protein component [Caldichromatium japonicum]